MKPPLGSIEIHGQSGPQITQDRDLSILRYSDGAELITQQLHGRYYPNQYESFQGAHSVSQATFPITDSRYAGMLLWNPPTSKIMAVPIRIKASLDVAPILPTVIGLGVGYHMTGIFTAPIITPLTLVSSTRIGNLSDPPNAQLYDQGFWTAGANPNFIYMHSDAFTANLLTRPSRVIDLEGIYGLKPGAYLCISTTQQVSIRCSFEWFEVPL